MAANVRCIHYFHTSVKDVPGSAYAVLGALAEQGVNLLAFNIVPTGPTHAQLALFPEETYGFMEAAERTGLVLLGPHKALLVQGDDGVGALLGVHEALAEAGVNVYASNGVTDGFGHYGYVIHVRPADIARAAEAVGC